MMSSGVAATARSLRVDVVSAEVVAGLQDAGVRSLLIKGPTLARLLYDNGAVRSYGDSDLLVAPRDFGRAQQVLARLGFEEVAGDWPEPWGAADAHIWQRSRDGAAVDLHRTICGFEGTPAEVWGALSEDSRSMSLCDADVETPSSAAAALLVVTHAAAHGSQGRKPIADLVRAIERLDYAVWAAAALLARRCGAEAALEEGLRLVPAGEQLADRLGLPQARSLGVRLRATTAPPESFVVARLATTRSLRAKARLLAHRFIPPRGHMRVWANHYFPRLYELDVGTAVLASYFLRPLRLTARIRPALRAYRQAQGEVEGATGARPSERGAAREGTAMPPRRTGPPRLRRVAAALVRLHKSGHLACSLRAAWWTLRAARRARRELAKRGLEAVRLPPVPPLPLGARTGVAIVLRRSTYTCLERALVRQAWLAAHDDRRDLVIGVRPPSRGFAAHAWLDGDPPCHGHSYAELLRQPAQ